MCTLTPFQQEKLTYFFKFFEPNENGVLDRHSLQHFIERVLEFTGWGPDSPDAKSLFEVHQTFFETMFDKTRDGCETYQEGAPGVTVEDWLAVWNNLLPGCKGMNNFPIWLRLLPKHLFRAIDRDKDGKITAEELFHFYHEMVKLPYEEAQCNSRNAFAQMTDDGNYPLTAASYEQMFANFLLGRTPYGPGRHIFGCFEHSVPTSPFQLIQPAKEEEDISMDVHVYLEKRPKRYSITSLT